MTGEMAMKLGRTAAYLFKKNAGRHRIVIGKDTRLSGYMLESALTSGICSMGVDVLLLGPLPTPAVAFITRSLRADAGVMISASHNPYQDNGIKFFSNEGFKLPDDMEERIEQLIDSGEIDSIRPTAQEIGKAFRIDDAEGRYIEFAKNTLPKGMDFQGIKVAVDCANGAAYKVVPAVFRELGAQVTTLGDDPNGININLDSGALHPERLCRMVVEAGADLGVAHDGDADRAVFVSEKGEVIDGDRILAAMALSLARENRLRGGSLVTTVMSNGGLEVALRPAGIGVKRTPVGDRYVLEEMLKEGCNLGGEPSGHIIFLDHNTTGDGPITALQVVSLMQRSGKRLSELSNCMVTLPQILLNVPVRARKDIQLIPGLAERVQHMERALNGVGRVLIRYSGTEPLLRIMVEGNDEKTIQTMAQELAEMVKREIDR